MKSPTADLRKVKSVTTGSCLCRTEALTDGPSVECLDAVWSHTQVATSLGLGLGTVGRSIKRDLINFGREGWCRRERISCPSTREGRASGRRRNRTPAVRRSATQTITVLMKSGACSRISTSVLPHRAEVIGLTLEIGRHPLLVPAAFFAPSQTAASAQVLILTARKRSYCRDASATGRSTLAPAPARNSPRRPGPQARFPHTPALPSFLSLPPPTMSTFPVRSIAESHAIMSSPGMPWEMEERVIRGVSVRAYKNLYASLRDLWLASKVCPALQLSFFIYPYLLGFSLSDRRTTLSTRVRGGAELRDNDFAALTCVSRPTDERITYLDSHLKVEAIARMLSTEFGCKKGDKVAIVARNLPEWILSFWVRRLSFRSLHRANSDLRRLNSLEASR